MSVGNKRGGGPRNLTLDLKRVVDSQLLVQHTELHRETVPTRRSRIHRACNQNLGCAPGSRPPGRLKWIASRRYHHFDGSGRARCPPSTRSRPRPISVRRLDSGWLVLQWPEAEFREAPTEPSRDRGFVSSESHFGSGDRRVFNCTLLRLCRAKVELCRSHRNAIERAPWLEARHNG